MKKTLLLVALFGTFASANAQQRRVEMNSILAPSANLSTTRGDDTLVLSSLTDTLLYYTYAGGYLTGTNDFNDLAKAQQFEVWGSVDIDEVLYLVTTAVNTGGASSVVNCRLYDMSGTGATTTGDGPAPGAIMAETPVQLDQLTGSMMSAMFTPTTFVGSFAAGIDLTGLADNDSIAIATSTEANGSETIDRSWEQWEDNDWYTLAQAWPLDVDMAVFPVYSSETIGINEGSWVNSMRMSILGGNPARDNVTISFENRNDARMDLFVIDAAGRTVLVQDLGSRAAGLHNYDMNTSTWNAGIYYVTLRADGQPMTLKLVKE